MLIICPNCSATYRIELSTLGPSGRNVRCARCRTVWMASAADAVTADLEPIPVKAETPEPPPAPPHPPPGASRPQEGRSLPEVPHDDPNDEAPSIVPGLPPDPLPAAPKPAAGDDIESAARRLSRARFVRAAATRKRSLRLTPLTTAIIAMGAIIGLIVNYRYGVVRAAPQTAPVFSALGMPVNLRGLEFQDVKLARETNGNVTIIGIEGVITNMTPHVVEIPRLRFAVHNAAGEELYAWTALPSQKTLEPKGELPFASRLASPPADSREIVIRFFNRRDAIGGRPQGQESLDSAAPAGGGR